MNKAEFLKFYLNNVLVKNQLIFHSLVFESKNLSFRSNESIKFHARHVLYCLNRFTSTSDILLMIKKLKKKRKVVCLRPK